jgi:hypothetical protein
LVQVEGASLHLAACIRSEELRGQDRYEAGQVFEATSADDTLPAEFSGPSDSTAGDAAFRPPGQTRSPQTPSPQTPSPLGDATEIQDPSAAPAVEPVDSEGEDR